MDCGVEVNTMGALKTRGLVASLLNACFHYYFPSK
jgi:hypothetical protein